MWQAVFWGYAAMNKMDKNPLFLKVYIQCKKQIINEINIYNNKSMTY